MYKKYFKRFFDILLALSALIILTPILIIISVLVAIKLGWPIIFRQNRVGFNNKVFKILKFRTMTDSVDDDGNYLPDEERLTRFGQILRSTSLDELPSLINILRGEMSIVGPRALPEIYLPYYSKEELKRHSIRPGLTGLSQINGRNYLTWEEKFKLDNEYVDSISFYNDLKIILTTVVVVVKRENIETGSFIEHEGVIYRPLNIERKNKFREE